MMPQDERRISAAEGQGRIKAVGEILEEMLQDMEIPIGDKNEKLNLRTNDLRFLIKYFDAPRLKDIRCTLDTTNLTFVSLRDYLAENCLDSYGVIDDAASEQGGHLPEHTANKQQSTAHATA